MTKTAMNYGQSCPFISYIEPRLVVNNQSKAFAMGYVYWRKTYFKLKTLFTDYHCQSYILFLASEVCSASLLW